MKLVLATPVYPPEIGGPATYVKELAERLKHEHQICIVAYASTSEKVPGTTLITVSKRRPLPVRLVVYLFKLFAATKGADVLYVQNGVASGLPAVLVGLSRGVPVVIKFVGDEAWERATHLRQTSQMLEEFLEHPRASLKIRMIMRLQGFVLRRAHRITTPSAYLARVVEHTYHVPAARIIVNYNAAEKTPFVPIEASVVPHQIAVTARLVEWKGIDGIIEAIQLLKKRFPDIRLMIAGDGPEEKHLKEITHTLGVSDHVVFLGRISRAETWHLRKTSHLYVLNSTYEGLPHTVLTSFAACIPVIATDISGTNEAVLHEKTGLLVPPHDTKALSHAIERLFGDKKLCERLVEGGSVILEEKFSWRAHLTTLIEILESVRTNPRH